MCAARARRDRGGMTSQNVSAPRRRLGIDWREAMRPQAGVTRWETAIAHLIPWLLVPSGLWRIALGLGVPVGFTGELAELYAAPGWITSYVFALTLLTELAGLTAFAFVQRWGVVVPTGLPGASRPWPPWLVFGAGLLEVVIVASATLPMAINWDGPENMGDPDAPQGAARVIMTIAYLPALAWAPLLAVLIGAAALRRLRAARAGEDPRP